MQTFTKDNRRFTSNQLSKMGVTDPIRVGFKVLQDVQPSYDPFKQKLVDTGATLDDAIVYKVVELTMPEIAVKITAHSKIIVTAVDKYMDKAITTIKGYDTRDSIGKFLVLGNPFYDECSKISLWIANCYGACYALQAAVASGEAEVPSVQDAIDALPVPDFLTEEEIVQLNAREDMFNGMPGVMM